MARVGVHRPLERVAHSGEDRAPAGAQPLALDRLEAEDDAAQLEREGGADLEDAEAVLDERAQGGLRLVIGRVALEDEPAARGQDAAQGPGLLPLVAEDARAREVDARVHDHRRHARPGVVEAARGEGPAREVERRLEVARRRHRRRRRVAHLAAGRGHVGSDHVERGGRPGRRLRAGRLGRRAEVGRPLAHDVGRRRRAGRPRIVAEAHARVEVQLDVTGPHALADELPGLRHRLGRRPAPPGVRPEVVAAEEEPLGRQPRVARARADGGGEVGRRLAGVAAVRVHLIAGRLHEGRCVVVDRLGERGVEHERVRRADRGEGHRLAAPLGADDVGEVARRAHDSHRSRFSATNASSARCG